MRKFGLAAVAAAAVLFGVISPAAGATEPPVPSQGPDAAVVAEQSAVRATGTYCVDVASNSTDAAGNSIIVASACSETSIADAKVQVKQSYASTQRVSAEAATTAAKAWTDLALLYSEYNQGGTGQRLLQGSAGPCDAAGYTFSTYAGDKFVKSMRGYNNCNAMRTKSDSGTGSIYSYYAMPGNLSGWLVGHVVQWHPYHS